MVAIGYDALGSQATYCMQMGFGQPHTTYILTDLQDHDKIDRYTDYRLYIAE